MDSDGYHIFNSVRAKEKRKINIASIIYLFVYSISNQLNFVFKMVDLH